MTVKNFSEIADRIGVFRIPRDSMMDYPDVVMQIMGSIIVIRCELVYGDNFYYTALSQAFGRVPPGQDPPQYMLVFTTSKKGNVTWAWQRVGL